jgi:hypothetical protein
MSRPRLILSFVVFSTVCLALGVGSAAAQQQSEFGTLSIQVRPPNARILVDGVEWPASETTAPLQIQLSPGNHRVEIRATGMQPFVREVTIRTGVTTPLNVLLTPAAQAAEPPSPQPAPRRAPAQPATRQAVQLAPGEDGYVFAPDVRVTEVNHQTSTLIGGYGGYVFAGQVMIGAGAYFQVYGTHGAYLNYVGPVVEYRLFPDKPVGLNLHALVGGGVYYNNYLYGYYPRPVGRYYGSPYGYYYNNAFFVFEPEAQVMFRFSPTLRLQAGIGYRATSAHGLDGVSGSFSLQIGR